ncbi:MAG: hypothetical protein SVY53_05305 [Chloroflexota bacterium]|nr:hypothetical protein [Chloroflexota bacterium]
MSKISQNATIILCVGIGSITIMECVALSNGINGTLFTAAIGTVAALIGGALGIRIKSKE